MPQRIADASAKVVRSFYAMPRMRNHVFFGLILPASDLDGRTARPLDPSSPSGPGGAKASSRHVNQGVARRDHMGGGYDRRAIDRAIPSHQTGPREGRALQTARFPWRVSP
jgi:hypothetical protein